MKSPGAHDRGLRASARARDEPCVYAVELVEAFFGPLRPAGVHWLASPLSGGFTTG
jgi:hypothetical protein